MSADLCRELRAVEYGIPLGRGMFYRPNPLTQKAAETIEKQAATIAELEKRIGELESAWDQLTKRHAEALTDLAAERQRREEVETDRRELLMMLAGRPDITALFGFKEKAVFEAARQHANSAPPSTTEAENE